MCVCVRNNHDKTASVSVIGYNYHSQYMASIIIIIIIIQQTKKNLFKNRSFREIVYYTMYSINATVLLYLQHTNKQIYTHRPYPCPSRV